MHRPKNTEHIHTKGADQRLEIGNLELLRQRDKQQKERKTPEEGKSGR